MMMTIWSRVKLLMSLHPWMWWWWWSNWWWRSYRHCLWCKEVSVSNSVTFMYIYMTVTKSLRQTNDPNMHLLEFMFSLVLIKFDWILMLPNGLSYKRLKRLLRRPNSRRMIQIWHISEFMFSLVLISFNWILMFQNVLSYKELEWLLHRPRAKRMI